VGQDVESGSPQDRLTRSIVARARALRLDALDADVLRVARDCLLDWCGVSLAAARDPLVDILVAVAEEEGGHPVSTLVGRAGRVSAAQAALINGAASHTLDYDDVNLTPPGHPSAAIFPAVLALAEARRASGSAVLAAFIAGYDTMCRVGEVIGHGHYERGFHATATLGTFGAAMACAHLIGLDEERALHAMGIAGTRAAGLKSMFGTMVKPLHAGLAAQSGLQAVLLAERGFCSRPDVLECAQGFGVTHAPGFDAKRRFANQPDGRYLLGNLFKFHAACYSVHSTIECARKLRQVQGVTTDQIRSLVVRVGAGCEGMCTIQSPVSGFEAKFSLRLAAAFGLVGLDTANLATYTTANALDTVIVDLRDRVRVDLVPKWGLSEAEMDAELDDGRRIALAHDSGQPLADKREQSHLVAAKFRSLAAPTLGAVACDALQAYVAGLEHLESITPLLTLCQPQA